MSVRRTVFDSILMSSVGVMRLLVQFLALPILSRILSQEDYGVVAMAMPFVFFAMLFADAGISASLVRTPQSERTVWGTCFWLSCGLGVALALVMAATGPLAGWVLGQPQLNVIIPVLASVLVAQGVCAVPGAVLHQAHRFKVIAAIEITACIGSLFVAVGMARAGFGAWALVSQQVALYGVRCVLTLMFAGFRPLFVFQLKQVHEHLFFGRDVMGMNLAMFLSRWLDNLIIGKVLGAAAAGVFSMAFQFARLPLMVVTGPLTYVLHARFVRVREDMAVLRAMFLLFTRGLAALIFPGVALVAACHAPFFTLLLSEKWAVAGQVFMLSAVGGALAAVTSLVGTVLLALGRADLRLKAALEQTVLWLLALLVMVWQGLEAAAMTYSAVMLIYTPRMVAMALPLIGCEVKEYWGAIMPSALVALAGAGLYGLVAAGFGEWAQLALAAVLAVAGISTAGLMQRAKILSLAGLCRQAA